MMLLRCVANKLVAVTLLTCLTPPTGIQVVYYIPCTGHSQGKWGSSTTTTTSMSLFLTSSCLTGH